MIALVMTVCLAASPATRHEERLLLDMPAMTCSILGQQAIAGWLNEHPGYRQRPGWRCEPPRSERAT